MSWESDYSAASQGHKEHVIGTWRKSDPRYKVTKSLAELSSRILWTVELLNDEIGYLAKETSKQSIEGSAWFHLGAYRKTPKERD